MSRIYNKPSHKLQSLFNREWNRAKKQLMPALDKKQKPKLFTSPTLGYKHWKNYGVGYNWVGVHFGLDSTKMQLINNHWIRASHVISLKESHVKNGHPKDLLRTIRHEICHTAQPNHGLKFKQLLKQLER